MGEERPEGRSSEERGYLSHLLRIKRNKNSP